MARRGTATVGGPTRTAALRHRRHLAFALIVIVALAACGSDPETTSAGGDDRGDPGPESTTESSPFSVGPAPKGYRLETAGIGTAEPTWGQDCCGTDEPYTVLSPDGAATGDEVVVVALTGYADQQGGLDQSSVADREDPERFKHEGREAIYLPEGQDRWADLLVAVDDEVAVRVTSPAATRDDLLEVVDGLEPPSGRRDAPAVDVPGLDVVGSVDVPGAVASRAYLQVNSGEVPGPPEAHSAGWACSYDGELTVQTLPGSVADIDALAVAGWGQRYVSSTVARPGEVAGRPAVVVERADDAGYAELTLAVESAWGDTVVVRAVGRPSLPAEEDLLAAAASVEQTDQASWDAFVIEATGGPGLNPDEGRAEVARGTVGDVEWLLQDGLPTGGGLREEPGPGTEAVQVESCLKLSTRTRACAEGSSGGTEGQVATARDPEEVPPFAIVSTTQPAASVRITTEEGEATAPLVPVPGGDLWAGVVFVDGLGIADCREDGPTPAPSLSVMRVDLLDDAGAPTGCIGIT
ncbi:hypothetical protein BH24ACT4_BH24ACT4_07390 [soil metagenome]